MATLQEVENIEAEVARQVGVDPAYREGYRAALRLLGIRAELMTWNPPVPLLLGLSWDAGQWTGLLEDPLLTRTVALSKCEAILLAILAYSNCRVVTSTDLAELCEADVRKHRDGVAIPAWLRNRIEPFDSARTVRGHITGRSGVGRNGRRHVRGGLIGALRAHGFKGLVVSVPGHCGGYRVTRRVWVFERTPSRSATQPTKGPGRGER